MDRYTLPKKKRLGQHFLQDAYIIDQIIHIVSPCHDDYFVEIGPGDGAITHLLLKHANVCAIELDSDLVSHLQHTFSDIERFSIVHADVLSLDYNRYTTLKRRWFGNLPYNISTPFLLSLIDIYQGMVDGIFMVQYEVAQRVVATPGSRLYGRLSVALARFFDSQIVLEVPKEAFDPPPKVHSAIILMRPKKARMIDLEFEKVFSKIVAQAFSQRRKMLRKIFANTLNEQQWADISLDSTARPEQLSPDDFERITRFIMSQG